MSKAGKLVKDLVKAKKESVMGKLANGDDPMEPWSKRFDAPIKEEALNEDTWLFRYIRSLGWDPTRMTFAGRSKYARSNAFKHWKQSHMERRPGETATMEEVENLDEAGTGLLMSYIKSKGLDPRMMDGNQKSAYSKSSEFRIFKNRHVKEVSGMGERGDDWNEEKKAVKEAVDAKDTVTMDIPLLIRVLEYAREDAKTDMDLHKVVENLINMRGKGSLSMDMYDKIVAIKEELEKLNELKKTTIRSYANKKQAELDDTPPMPFKKPAKSKAETEKAAKGMMGALARLSGKKPTSEEVEQIDELSVNKMLKYSDAAEKDRKKLNAKWDAGTASRKEQEKAIGREEGENRATNKIKKKTGKYPWQLSREETEQIEELSKGTLTSYATKARADAANLSKQGDSASKRSSTKSMQTALDKFRKAAKRNIGAAGAESKARVKEEVEQVNEMDKTQTSPGRDGGIDWTKKQIHLGPEHTMKAKDVVKHALKVLNKTVKKSHTKDVKEEVEQIDELKKQNDNMEIDDRITREEKKMKGADPCWKGYQMVGTKKKGGRTVPNCVPEETEITEGIYGIEDSPMSATNSVKAMESTGRKKQMTKSARMIKSIYKKKNVKETIYDWEKIRKGWQSC